MDNARGFVLHTTDWTGEGSLKVNETVALTASLDVLKAIAEGNGPREGILALGYAGWGPGSSMPKSSRTPGCRCRRTRPSCLTMTTTRSGAGRWAS